MGKQNVPEIRFENDVPWKRNRFGELYRKSDERNNGQFGWNKTISIATMTWNETGNGAADSSLASYKVLRTGDIAFEGHTNKEFQFGRFVLNDIGDGITSSIFTILRPTTNQNIIFWKYLIHDEAVMRRKLVYSTKSGIMMNGLVVDDFMKQTIRFPSLPVQREIADLFSSLDRKLAAEQKKLAALKMAKHALLVKIFPREGETVPEIRFEGFSHPWEQRKFDDFVTFYSGLTYAPNDVQDSGTLVLRSSNVKDGEVISADDVYVNPSKATSENVKSGDLIVVVRNGSRALIGKHAQIKRSMPNTVIGAFMTGIRSDHSEFVNALLDTPQFKKEVDMNMGATINQITGYMFSQMEFMVPSEVEQDKLGGFFKDLDNCITLHQRKCDKLRQAKSALLNQMFV